MENLNEPNNINLLNVENINKISKSRNNPLFPEKDILNIEINGSSVEILEKLGSGGTKEVYSINWYGEEYALGICGKNDLPEVVIRKWEKVKNEPQNTEILRENGFFVNDLCKIQQIKINGYSFPGILMKNYQDHDFKIFDAKNPNKYENINLLKESEISEEVLLRIFNKIIDDISFLIEKGVNIGRDSINLCVKDNVMRLYFNDLDSMRIKKSSVPQNIEFLAQFYADCAIGAFANNLPSNLYYNNKYVNALGSIDSLFSKSLSEAVIKKINSQNPAK